MSFVDQTVYILTSTSSLSKLKRFLYSLSVQLKDAEQPVDDPRAKELAIALLELVTRPVQPSSTTSMSESDTSRGESSRKSSVASLALRCLLHLTRRNSDGLLSDWLSLLGDLPSRPGLLSLARTPRNFGTSEAAFALQTCVSLLRSKNLKNFEIVTTAKTAVHGFLSNQEVIGWGVREIVVLMIGNLSANVFEPPTPNSLDLRSAATAVLVELCINVPWARLPASLALDLISAIDQNLNLFTNSLAQLPFLQALTILLALSLPLVEIRPLAVSLVQKFVTAPVPLPALFEALAALIKQLAKATEPVDVDLLPLVLRGLSLGGILISAVRCVAPLAALQRQSALPLLQHMLEISSHVDEGPLKAEIIEAAAACHFNAQTEDISDQHTSCLVELIAAGGKSATTKLRAAVGRVAADVLVSCSRVRGDFRSTECVDLAALLSGLLNDASVEVLNASLRGLMLTVSSQELEQPVRKFLVDNFRGRVRELAMESTADESAMRRERVRADAVRAIGVFGDLDSNVDTRLIEQALNSKIFPIVQSAVWTVEKHCEVFCDSLEVKRQLTDICKRIKDETNARRLLQCASALLRLRADVDLAQTIELLSRRFPGALTKK